MPESSPSPKREIPREEVQEASSSEKGEPADHQKDDDWPEREDALYRAIDRAIEDEKVADVKRKGRLKNAWTRCRVWGIYVASFLFLLFVVLIGISLGTYYFTPWKWLDSEQIEFIHNSFGKFTLVFAAFVFGAKSRDFMTLIRDTFSE